MIEQLGQPGWRNQVGTFRLMGLRDAIIDGRREVLAELCDGSGSAMNVVVTPFADGLRSPEVSFVQGELMARLRGGSLLVDALTLKPIEAAAIHNAGLLIRVESREANVQRARLQLVEFIDSITSLALRVFVNQVLLDPRVIDRFGVMALPGGPHPDHLGNFPGGLLVASTRSLTLCADLTRQALRKQDSDAGTVAAIGYLFRYLVAIEREGQGGPHGTESRPSLRDFLAPHLSQLGSDYRAAALALHQIFHHYELGMPAATRPSFIGAEAVLSCARLDSAAARQSEWARLLAGPSRNDSGY